MFYIYIIRYISLRFLRYSTVLVWTFSGLVTAAPNVQDAAEIPRPQPTAPPPALKPIDIKQQEKPAYRPTAEEKEAKLLVQRFVFSGNQVFNEAQLAALLQTYTGQEIGLKTLRQAVSVITEHYRKHGYFLAQAYLPEQDIKNNTIEIAVLEGRLGQFKLNGADKLDAEFIQKMAAYQLQSGDTIKEGNLVKNVTLLNALPGLQANAQLNPGAEVGSSDIEIGIEALPAWRGFASINTYGNRFTGREVLLGGLLLNNLAGVGDQFFVSLKNAREERQRGVQLSYLTPVHASGTLLNASYNYVDYRLGGAFKSLKASGDGHYLSVNVDQPIVRNAQYGLTARLGGAYKWVNDEVAAVSLNNRRNVANIDFALFGDWYSSSDISHQIGANLRAGRVSFKDDFAERLDETGAKTAGDFLKLNLTATQTHYLKNSVSIALRADYQWTNTNLDSVEKMTIGGINRWRQFAELPSLADSGWMLGAELRKRVAANPSLASLLLVEVSPYAFLDGGRGRINQNALSGDNHVKSVQAGFGMDFLFKRDWQLSVTASHQSRDFDGASAENETRLWGQLQKEF